MRALATVTMTAAFLAFGGPAAAQTFGFGAHAGVSMPTGNYSDVADLGFSGGLDFTLPLTMVSPALSWYTSADVAGHSATSDAIDGGFLSIPVLTGVRFDIPLGVIRPFVTGQLGLGFVQSPSVGDASSSTNTGLAYALGAGLQLTNNIYAGAKWFNLGDVDFGPPPSSTPVSYVDFYVGFGVR
jgi:opacity protein-like surface antigen